MGNAEILFSTINLQASRIEIEDEAKRYAPVPIGKAIITHAGRLKCRYVIHAPTVEYPGSKSSIENVEKATKAVIDVAKSKGDVKSIALPLMGAGVGGLKPEESIESMVKVIEVEKPENMNFFIYVLDNETLMKVLGKLKEIGWICT